MENLDKDFRSIVSGLPSGDSTDGGEAMRREPSQAFSSKEIDAIYSQGLKDHKSQCREDPPFAFFLHGSRLLHPFYSTWYDLTFLT